MDYIVNNFGNGCCIEISPYRGLIIDFGSLDTKINVSPFYARDPSKLLISHYHKDHYNGLGELEDNSINIQELYYPYIPDIPEEPVIMKFICLYNLIINGRTNGSPAKDLIDVLQKRIEMILHANMSVRGIQLRSMGTYLRLFGHQNV
jgi:Cft2 family RNA processing exonuclease